MTKEEDNFNKILYIIKSLIFWATKLTYGQATFWATVFSVVGCPSKNALILHPTTREYAGLNWK